MRDAAAAETTCQSRGAVTLRAVRRLQVGLVEAGEAAVRRERLQVGVEVRLAVLGIAEAMEAVAGEVERVLVLQLEAIGGFQDRGWQPEAMPALVRVHGAAVHDQAAGLTREIDEEWAVGVSQAERDERTTEVPVAVAVELELKLVAHIVNARCAMQPPPRDTAHHARERHWSMPSSWGARPPAGLV